MKSQLTACHQGRIKTFGFGSILLSFFFERIPSQIPWVSLRTHAAIIPAMGWWKFLMLRLGGGRVVHPFDDEYFHWWSHHIVAIEDYPYAGINFSQDRDIVVPLCSRLGAISKFFVFFNVLWKAFKFCIYTVTYYLWVLTTTSFPHDRYRTSATCRLPPKL